MDYLSSDVIYHKDLNNVSGLVESYNENGCRVYLDPFCEHEDWISCYHFNKVMREYYGLNPEQVFNKIHNLDKDAKHYCLTCGGEVHLIKWSKGFAKYCCPSCSSSAIMSNLNKQWWSGERENPYTNSIEQFALIERSYELRINSEVSYTNRFLYFVVFSDRFKVGIHQDAELDQLMHYIHDKYGRNYDHIILYYDDKNKVVETECDIKILNNSHRLLNRGERGWTETFSIQYLESSLKLVKLNKCSTTRER